MKKMLMVVLAVCLVTTVANAKMVTVRETYIVQDGDTLSSIAEKFSVPEYEVVKGNPWVVNLKREQWNGRTLTIKKKVSDAPRRPAEKSGKLVWKWRNVGADPFGSRNVKKGIEKLAIPKEVKAGLLSAIANGDFKLHRIMIGDRFEQMISGNYKVYTNVVADFNPAYKDGLNADLYQFDYDGKRYFLVKPYVCMNWSWWLANLVGQTEEKEELAVAEVNEEEVTSRQEQVEEKVIIAPAPIKTEDEYPVYRPIKKTSAYIPADESPEASFDGSVFAGHSRQLQEYGTSSYAGTDLTLYPINMGEWSIGVSGQYVAWQGTAFNDPQMAYSHWTGNKWLAGLGVKHLGESNETTLKVRFGEKKGDFKLLTYRNEESNRIINLEAYHTLWFAGDQWFHSVEGGVRVDLDQGGSKKSWSGNAAIPPSQDLRLDQSEYSVSLKTEVYRVSRNLVYTVGGNYTYAAYDKESVITPQVGVKIWKDIINLSAGYQFPEKRREAYEGNLMIDLDKLVRVF